jgi:hypothetical protein
MKTVILVSFVISTFWSSFAMGQEAKAEKKDKDDTYQAIMSTKFDFSDTDIRGDMRAPDGFYLQGRQSQSLSQMVKLRSEFKRQLRNSRSGVRAAVR